MGSDDAFLFDREQRTRALAQERARDVARVGDAWRLRLRGIENWAPGTFGDALHPTGHPDPGDHVDPDYVDLRVVPWSVFVTAVDGARGLLWLAVIGRVVRDHERERFRERARECLAPGSSPEDWGWTHDGPRVAVFCHDCDTGTSTFTRDAIAPEVDPVEEAHAPTSIPPIASARRTPGKSLRALMRGEPTPKLDDDSCCAVMSPAMDEDTRVRLMCPDCGGPLDCGWYL